jgi:flagellar hook-basal body complex protein FliE
MIQNSLPIQQIQGLSELSSSAQKNESASESNFNDMLTNAISGLDASLKNSEAQMNAFVAGETDNLHQVMISMQEAHINFQMVTEIRNKAIEAFQDLSRMQI